MEQLYCMTMYNVQPARAVVKTSEWSSILRHFFRIYDVQFTFALDDIGNNNGGFAGANRCDKLNRNDKCGWRTGGTRREWKLEAVI